MTTIYLTKEERPLYDALSEDLKGECDVEGETGDVYETEEQLAARLVLLSRHDDPDLQAAMKECHQKMERGEEIDGKELMEKISDEVMPAVLFTLGAEGVGYLILYALKEVDDADGLEGIANLSYIRHVLLETNASIPVLPNV